MTRRRPPRTPGCTCPDCTPRGLTANARAAWGLAGLVLGHAVALLLDAHALTVMYGPLVGVQP